MLKQKWKTKMRDLHNLLSNMGLGLSNFSHLCFTLVEFLHTFQVSATPFEFPQVISDDRWSSSTHMVCNVRKTILRNTLCCFDEKNKTWPVSTTCIIFSHSKFDDTQTNSETVCRHLKFPPAWQVVQHLVRCGRWCNHSVPSYTVKFFCRMQKFGGWFITETQSSPLFSFFLHFVAVTELHFVLFCFFT